ncbi:TraB/GumN family protein [Candidatus Woesearchaeota archaeon]|nr:TraB/GumN family protein [Candidatus Woesearchaeota archaeon]
MAIKYNNLTIVGTSHIAKESLEQVANYIEKELPDIIALELDKKRLYALLAGKKKRARFKDIRQLGIKVYVLNLIGAYIEEKLGKMVGVKPGSEMRLAYQLAQKHRLKIALIDQNIEITLKRLSKAITWKEKFSIVADILKALILRKPEIEIDLTKVPPEEIISLMIEKVKKRYPNFYKVLIEERNQFMAKRLAALLSKFPDKKILAIVGAGHERELLMLIKKELGFIK